MKNLSDLLQEVDALFGHTSREPKLSPYDYTLGRYPYGWNFSIRNSRYKWNDANLKHDFGVWQIPENAVREFLDYVKENNIDVESLMDKSTE